MGKPDFIHWFWDVRVPGDVTEGDTVVFGKGTDREPFCPFVFDDSSVF